MSCVDILNVPVLEVGRGCVGVGGRQSSSHQLRMNWILMDLAWGGCGGSGGFRLDRFVGEAVRSEDVLLSLSGLWGWGEAA